MLYLDGMPGTLRCYPGHNVPKCDGHPAAKCRLAAQCKTELSTAFQSSAEPYCTIADRNCLTMDFSLFPSHLYSALVLAQVVEN